MAFAQRQQHISREGSLSRRTCSDTRLRFTRSYPQEHPVQSTRTTNRGYLGPSLPPSSDPHGVIQIKNVTGQATVSKFQHLLRKNVYVLCFKSVSLRQLILKKQRSTCRLLYNCKRPIHVNHNVSSWHLEKLLITDMSLNFHVWIIQVPSYRTLQLARVPAMTSLSRGATNDFRFDKVSSLGQSRNLDNCRGLSSRYK